MTALTATTAGTGYEVVEGKMVLELLPAGRSRKGGAVERLVRESNLQVVLYAGDDVADIEAFEALGRLAAQGVRTTTIAVDGPETPDPLLAAADVIVTGPSGLLDVLRQLA
jgi:trehalose 6-phosphate phosphatase